MIAMPIRSLVLGLCVVCVGCGEDAEQRARYVKQPFASQQSEVGALDAAHQEAKTRLTSVRTDKLREDLARDIDAEYERRLTRLREAEERSRQRAAEEAARVREAERQRLVAAEAEQRRQQDALQQQMARDAVAEQHRRHRQAVIDLETSLRSSAVENLVLQLRNGSGIPLSFDLRCFTRNDRTFKTMFVTIPPRGQREIGFLEGWDGNFVAGERCEARLDNEVLWNRVVR